MRVLGSLVSLLELHTPGCSSAPERKAGSEGATGQAHADLSPAFLIHLLQGPGTKGENKMACLSQGSESLICTTGLPGNCPRLRCHIQGSRGSPHLPTPYLGGRWAHISVSLPPPQSPRKHWKALAHTAFEDRGCSTNQVDDRLSKSNNENRTAFHRPTCSKES